MRLSFTESKTVAWRVIRDGETYCTVYYAEKVSESSVLACVRQELGMKNITILKDEG